MPKVEDQAIEWRKFWKISKKKIKAAGKKKIERGILKIFEKGNRKWMNIGKSERIKKKKYNENRVRKDKIKKKVK